jgi:hypothetical protein
MNSLTELQDVWLDVLADLALQMSRATYNNFFQQTRLVAIEPDELYVVDTRSEPARAWLDQRLRRLVEQSLARRVGEGARLKFIVAEAGLEAAASPPQPAAPPAAPPEAQLAGEKGVSLPAQAGPLAVAEPPCQAGPASPAFGQVDFELLWQKSGFTMTPDYAHHYWRAYLGRAFELWELLVSRDKRDVRQMRQGTLPYWTPPRLYRYRGLARILGCARNSLTGRLQACWLYEGQKAAARVRGEALPPLACCGRFEGSRPCPGPSGEPRCVYWREGALERLCREGLVAVERISHPGSPRAHELRLQVWRLLPVLTPHQVACFKNEAERDSHRQWLERYSHLAGFDLQGWEQFEAPSLIPHLPGYTWGRQLFQAYRNNPFAEVVGGGVTSDS